MAQISSKTTIFYSYIQMYVFSVPLEIMLLRPIMQHLIDPTVDIRVRCHGFSIFQVCSHLVFTMLLSEVSTQHSRDDPIVSTYLFADRGILSCWGLVLT